MGGDATFSGTTYQARVIAHIYVHILATTRLGWLGPTADDTPLAVSGETKGPGDDARIEFGDRHTPIEVQAKHGLTGGAKLQEVVDHLAEPQPSSGMKVILAVDRGSTRSIYTGFAKDLQRIRVGRTDDLTSGTNKILAATTGGLDTLARLFVVPLDLNDTHDLEAKLCLHLLSSILQNPAQANAAWSVLIDDANNVCAKKLRRTRTDLINLLKAADIIIKPPVEDELWHRQLDFAKRLLDEGKANESLIILKSIRADIDRTKVAPRVLLRLEQHTASALLHLGRFTESLLYARRALDIEPDHVAALVVSALAQLYTGDLVGASAAADRAVSVAPNEPKAWSAAAIIASTTSESLPSPPSEVASSEQYRLILAEIAQKQEDWSQVLDITSALLQEAHRSPEALLLRAQANVSIEESVSSVSAHERYTEAEQLASEIIDSEDIPDQLIRKALSIRAYARKLMKRSEDALGDLEKARQISNDDPNIIGHTAQLKMIGGDYSNALNILNSPITERFPMLIALRAAVHTALENHTAAQEDLTAASHGISEASDPYEMGILVADTAHKLSNFDLADKVLAELESSPKKDTRLTILQGRIAFDRGQVDLGTSLFQEAIEHGGPDSHGLAEELGRRLFESERLPSAIDIFERLGEDHLSNASLRCFTLSLYKTGDLSRANAIVDRLLKSENAPTWAIAIAVDIALLREDTKTAIDQLTVLVDNAHTTLPAARIKLADLLIEHGKLEDAYEHLAKLIADNNISAVESIRVAHMLRAAGHEEEAINIAFGAFRREPQDPRTHRGLISLMIPGTSHTFNVSEVDDGTHVVLSDQDGNHHKYTVYADGPIDPLRGEIDLAKADSLGILGKKIGDVIIRNEGTWQEKKLTVKEIIPAVIFAVRDAAKHYEERFPGEPFFITSFNVTSDLTIKDLQPLIASINARSDQVREVFDIYRESIPPLGLITKLLGGTIPEVMAHASGDPENYGPMTVEWSDRSGQLGSREAATSAYRIVITWSALHTAEQFGLLSHISNNYSIVAPLSLKRELQDALHNAEQLITSGHTTMGSGVTGFSMTEFEPGHPALRRRRDHLQSLMDWLEKFCQFEPRPLSSIGQAAPLPEDSRETIGYSSFDALALAKEGLALYADDLGLRILASGDGDIRSFSSISLIYSLADQFILTPDERDEYLIKLIQANYATVLPSVDLLIYAIRMAANIPPSTLIAVFSLLTAQQIAINEAADIVARVLRATMSLPIQLISVERITRIALEAMSRRWPARLCSKLVSDAAAIELALLPTDLRTVQQICGTFVGHGASS